MLENHWSSSLWLWLVWRNCSSVESNNDFPTQAARYDAIHWFLLSLGVLSALMIQFRAMYSSRKFSQKRSNMRRKRLQFMLASLAQSLGSRKYASIHPCRTTPVTWRAGCFLSSGVVAWTRSSSNRLQILQRLPWPMFRKRGVFFPLLPASLKGGIGAAGSWIGRIGLVLGKRRAMLPGFISSRCQPVLGPARNCQADWPQMMVWWIYHLMWVIHIDCGALKPNCHWLCQVVVKLQKPCIDLHELNLGLEDRHFHLWG